MVKLAAQCKALLIITVLLLAAEQVRKTVSLHARFIPCRQVRVGLRPCLFAHPSLPFCPHRPWPRSIATHSLQLQTQRPRDGSAGSKVSQPAPTAIPHPCLQQKAVSGSLRAQYSWLMTLPACADACGGSQYSAPTNFLYSTYCGGQGARLQFCLPIGVQHAGSRATGRSDNARLM